VFLWIRWKRDDSGSGGDNARLMTSWYRTHCSFSLFFNVYNASRHSVEPLFVAGDETMIKAVNPVAVEGACTYRDVLAYQIFKKLVPLQDRSKRHI
jgi:hypothetical protein